MMKLLASVLTSVLASVLVLAAVQATAQTNVPPAAPGAPTESATSAALPARRRARPSKPPRAPPLALQTAPPESRGSRHASVTFPTAEVRQGKPHGISPLPRFCSSFTIFEIAFITTSARRNEPTHSSPHVVSPLGNVPGHQRTAGRLRWR